MKVLRVFSVGLVLTLASSIAVAGFFRRRYRDVVDYD